VLVCARRGPGAEIAVPLGSLAATSADLVFASETWSPSAADQTLRIAGAGPLLTIWTLH
jgi:hypothetical protein